MTALDERSVDRLTRKPQREAWSDFVHTGPDTLAGRYLRRFWHPVCRSQDLATGQLKPVRIMSEDFTIYRGESGAAHAVAFRCAHRGTQLTAGWVQGENIRCFYHGWMYDPSGQCVEQPGESEPFCQRIRIRSYPIHEYVGLIFLYLGEGDPPSPPRVPALDNAEGLIENWREDWACNYFNRLENAPDLMHVPFVHSHHGTSVPTHIEARETDFGFETRARRGGSDWSDPTRFHMPNMNYFVGRAKAPEFETGPRHNFMWRVPVDDERHMVFGAERVQVGPGDSDRYREWQRSVEEELQREPMDQVARRVLAGELPNRYVHETRQWDTSSAQDYVVLMGQGIVADREHEHLGKEDVGVVLLRQIYVRELRALAQGRPLKQWKWSADETA